MDNVICKPIAVIKTDYKEKFGIPRQSGKSPSSIGVIVFEKEYRNPDALRGIDGFSHLWIIFDFSMSHTDKFNPTVRPPRLGGNERMGVFATRSPFRPNPIGLSSVKLEKAETTEDGVVLIVSGVDLLDGTPILDIKPYIKYADCHEDAVCGFVDENEQKFLTVEYDSDVTIPFTGKTLDALNESLREDPRPAFKEDGDKVYSMLYGNYDVKFVVKDNVLTVISIK